MTDYLIENKNQRGTIRKKAKKEIEKGDRSIFDSNHE